MNIIENNNLWRNPIETLPLNQAFPQMEQLAELGMLPAFKQFDDKKVVLSKDHDRLFGVFSKKSVIVEHTEAVTMVNNVLTELYGEEPEIELTSMKNGAKIIAKFNLKGEKELDIGNGDLSNFNLLLTNSYDKALPFKLQIGCMRLVCTNGLILGQDIHSIKANQLLSGWTIEGLSKKVKKLTAQSHEIVNDWRRWTKIQIPRNVAVESLADKFPKKFIEPILEPANFPSSKWDLYNDLTRRSTHDIASESTRHSFDQIISRIFYGKKGAIYEHELEYDERDISDLVTVTEEIEH